MLGENGFGVIVLSHVHGKKHAEQVSNATGIQLRSRFPTTDKNSKYNIIRYKQWTHSPPRTHNALVREKTNKQQTNSTPNKRRKNS